MQESRLPDTTLELNHDPDNDRTRFTLRLNTGVTMVCANELRSNELAPVVLHHLEEALLHLLFQYLKENGSVDLLCLQEKLEFYRRK